MESDIKNVIICGLGAIGTIYADKIYDITPNNLRVLVDKTRKERYEKNPVIFNGRELRFNYLLPEDNDFKADLIIIATKSGGLSEALENMKNFVKPDTIILSLLNGVTSEEIIAQEYGWDKVLLSFFIGHSAVREGRCISHDDVNCITFGEKNPDNILSEKTLRLKKYFDKIGITYKIPSDMYYEQWQKFMLNVTCNQLSAILRMTFGEMQKNIVFKTFARNIMQEVVSIAKAEGVHNSENLISGTEQLIEKMIPEGKTSMLQDIEAGRKTEVDIFAGTVVELGKKHNLPTPYNKMMLDMIEILHENQNIKNRELAATSK